MELTYMKHGDYYLPNLDIPAQEKVPVNRYGRMHGDGIRQGTIPCLSYFLYRFFI